MNKRNNMLREKRKHANYKPNRRLDAKSSRGMIYENEELRIRTININAEVERGQSEIKTLKREREQLRREIWTLRDEYDKLEKLLRIKGIDPDHFLNQKDNNGDDDEEGDENLSDCSECSCENCCGEDCHDEKSDNPNTEKGDESSNEQPKSGSASASKDETQQANSSKNLFDEHKRPGKDRLNLNFDHLSIVSEETSEGTSVTQNEDSSIPIHDLSAFLHSVDVLSPLSYLQKLSPPLAHFENLNYDQMGGTSVDQHGNIHHVSTAPLVLSPSPFQPKKATNNVESIMKQKSTPEVSAPATSYIEPPVKKQSRLKHFFSPIRKKQAPQPPPPAPPPPVTSQPDVYISNIVPHNMYINPATQISPGPDTSDPKPSEVSSPTSSFQTGGNLEELLFDIEALSKDIMDLQTQCTNSPNDAEPTLKKPFRSELNLVLSYPPPSQENVPPPPPFPGDMNLHMPTPMELLNPLSHTNPLYIQNLPSPFPSPIPSSPLTPPTNFKMNDGQYFEPAPDYSQLKFPPLNSPLPLFASNNSIFCTVSAPSTPASDRKCIDKYCVTDPQKGSVDKKKAKRVSIVNTKDESNEKNTETPEGNEGKDTENKDKKSSVDVNANSTGNSNHHSHMHRNHSHGHLHPKRRMSLDNTTNCSKQRNHRQICQDPNARVQRRESNRSNSFKKRSRSESMHDDPGGTSMSERYSNSIASSRESSTSLSMRSGKRRISITSYGGSKKIPWCGCWGTSCI